MARTSTHRTITPEIGKAYVRILGKQLDRFIEFEFFLNDEDLSVELVMPETAFAEFCAYYDAEIVPQRGAELSAVPQRTAGLYRPSAGEMAE